MSSYVVFRRGKFSVDQGQRPATLLTNEIILRKLIQFLHENFKKGSGRLLDVGSGSLPYFPVYRNYFSSTYSVDVPWSPHDITSVDVTASILQLPFRDGFFDCVLLTEVLEHIPEPVQALEECRRVLKENGKLFLTTPLLVPLHEIPHDYFRYTPFALRYMGQRVGLRVESIAPKGGFWAFALLFMQFPWVRLWQWLAGRLRLPLLHPYNPVVYLTIILPQLFYIALWSRRMQHGGGEGDEESTVTLGYVTVLSRS
ncbi:methyltransferase domain-containing protein [Methylococcus geothermalis]|uniref:Methyltransferase domain-containing protein n=1 Tax=Methylococcus geothermalis TaxID=2681310 RepID=A0A858QBK1_9GAMM|nr:methyltransferase domain-containing protein [Methylococcus geothermalis]